MEEEEEEEEGEEGEERKEERTKEKGEMQRDQKMRLVEIDHWLLPIVPSYQH